MCARSLFCTCACVVVGVSTAALLGRWFHRYYTATVCGDISGLIHNLAHKLHQFQALWQTFTCTFLPKCRQHARHTHSHSPIVLTFPNFCPVTLETETLNILFFIQRLMSWLNVTRILQISRAREGTLLIWRVSQLFILQQMIGFFVPSMQYTLL